VALIVSTWWWGSRYSQDYVDKLRFGVSRNLSEPHRFAVFNPQTDDWHLKAFGFKEGDRIVCMDLDMVITGSLDDLFDREEPFTILQGVNSVNPCPFNGSLWMLKAGYRPDVWNEFSLDLAAKVPHHEFPDDQAWFADMMPDAGAFGPEQGVYAFQKKSWPKGDDLPRGAKIVAFPGYRDPSQFTHLSWVKEHWSL
jgi:hypothetical protein